MKNVARALSGHLLHDVVQQLDYAFGHVLQAGGDESHVPRRHERNHHEERHHDPRSENGIGDHERADVEQRLRRQFNVQSLQT